MEVEAGREELSLLLGFSSPSCAVGLSAVEVDDDDGGCLDLERLALRQPPPTGTLRRTPPLVQ